MSDMPFIETNASTPAAALRAEMSERGYVFFRGLVPVNDVLAVRREVIDICHEQGWVDESHPVMEACVKPGTEPLTEGNPAYMAAYRKVLKSPGFHNLPCHASLMSIAAKLLDHAEPLVHPRRIGRITFPNYEVATTPAHQDHFYIRGAVETYSCWMPLGAVPILLGGLAVWPGSHTQGFMDHSEHIKGAVGGRGVPVNEAQAVWHTTDFQPGDALFFHSYTIHKALPNKSGNQLRLSTDNRYQRPVDPIDPGALRPHYDLD